MVSHQYVNVFFILMSQILNGTTNVEKSNKATENMFRKSITSRDKNVFFSWENRWPGFTRYYVVTLNAKRAKLMEISSIFLTMAWHFRRCMTNIIACRLQFALSVRESTSGWIIIKYMSWHIVNYFSLISPSSRNALIWPSWLIGLLKNNYLSIAPMPDSSMQATYATETEIETESLVSFNCRRKGWD